MTERQDTWYFIGGDGTEFGPYPRATLTAMRASGQVRASDLVWTPGMEGWQRFSEVLPPPVPATHASGSDAPTPTPGGGPVSPVSQATEPAVGTPGGADVDSWPSNPDTDGTAGGSSAPTGVEFGGAAGGASVLPPLASPGEDSADTSPHPWRRYFARFLDLLLFGIIAAMVAVALTELIAPDRSDSVLAVLDNQFVATIAILACWIPFEAFALSVFGTTPGRSLFGIVVRDRNGEALGFDKSLERSARVVFQGLAAGVPIVVLFTQWFAYRRLTTTGTTLWDQAVDAVVTHKPWGPARTIGSILAVIIGLLIMGGLAAIGAAAA